MNYTNLENFYMNTNMNNAYTPVFNIKERKYKKDKTAFESKAGVCYVDQDGKTYTYDDLYKIAGSEEATEVLFDALSDTIEKSLKDSVYFVKCKRCGSYNFNSEFSWLKKNEVVCPKCRPIRTNGVIQIERDPYEDERKFYTKRKATFLPGVTTLIGCNGIGKTTLLHNIKDELMVKGVPVFLFDNMSDDGGGHAGVNMLSRILTSVDKKEDDSFELAALLYTSSEGECIKNALIQFANQLLRNFKKYVGFGEYWILFDAIDSGLSLDTIEYLKQYLFKVLIKKLPSDSQVYIISSSNSYELSEGTQIFSVTQMKYVNVKTYNAYKKAILNSLEYKNKRDYILEVKSEIWNREYEWKVNEEVIKEYNSRKDVTDENVFVLMLDDYKMTMSITSSNGDHRTKYHLYKKLDDQYSSITDNQFTKRKIREMDIDNWTINIEKNKKAMHDCICEHIYRDLKKQRK